MAKDPYAEPASGLSPDAETGLYGQESDDCKYCDEEITYIPPPALGLSPDTSTLRASGLSADTHAVEEDINGLEETKGCATLDSGATVMCSSTVAAEEIQTQRINRSEPGQPTVSKADRRVRFADGRVDEAQMSWNNRSHRDYWQEHP